MATVYLTDGDFHDLYEPVMLPGGQLYWSEGEVQRQKIPNNRVWSVLEHDDGGMTLIPGKHWVNVVDFMVTVMPWTTDDIEVRWLEPDDDEDEPDYGDEEEE